MRTVHSIVTGFGTRIDCDTGALNPKQKCNSAVQPEEGTNEFITIYSLMIKGNEPSNTQKQ